MAKQSASHEDYTRHEDIKAGSERAFGIVFAVVFAVISLLPLTNQNPVRYWALIVAVVFIVAAFLMPKALRPLNILWFRFGMLLHKIVNPIIMGLLFFTTVTPMAIIMRISGKDPLRLRFDPHAKSYWIKRQPPGPKPETMRHQF